MVQDDDLGDADLGPMEAADLSITTFTRLPDLANFVLEVDRQLQNEEREPTTQMGDYVYSTHDRLTTHGGTYRNGLDQFSKKLSMRSMGSGDDVDYAFEAGNATARFLPVPRFRLVKRALKPFRASWSNGAAETSPDESANTRPQRRSDAFQLSWSEVQQRLIETAALPNLNPTLRENLTSLLGDDDRLGTLEDLYGSSVQMTFYIHKFAQPKDTFDLKAASFGQTYWVLDRTAPDSYTHRYRGAFAPTKTFLTERYQKYFADHPDSERLLRLRQETNPRPDAPVHPMGRGRLRHRGYNEIHVPAHASVERRNQAEANRQNLADSWEIRYHHWEAYKEAFLEWSLDLSHSVRANQELEHQFGAQLTVSADFDPVRDRDPFEGITAKRYFDYFVQSPVSFEYLLWTQVEDMIQFRTAKNRTGTDAASFDPDNFVYSESDRLHALELVADVMSWMERLPRAWKDGKIYWHWRTDPGHKRLGWKADDKSTWLSAVDYGHCQGCQHYDTWVPTDQYDAAQNPSWKQQEAAIWYATRQELQLFRKAIYTHNTGSGNADAMVDGLLTTSAIIDFRHKYGGGGRERIPPDCWYIPPEVDPYFWLGTIYERAQRKSNRPYNGWTLQSSYARLAVQNSRKEFEELLGLNTNMLGIADEDVKKKLPAITFFHDGIVFPTNSGEGDYTEEELNRKYAANDPVRINPWGHSWKKFRPTFDPLHPRLTLYRDPFFHLDPLWFTNRNYFDPIMIDHWIEAFEDAFANSSYDGYRYIMTWPDGSKTATKSFRSPEFRQYLISQFLNHKALALDFHQNQEIAGFEETIVEKLRHAVKAGDFDLRPIIDREMIHLPLYEPVFNDQGAVTGQQPTVFRKLQARLFEMADNRSMMHILIITAGGDGTARGLDWGHATSLVKGGFGQGYGSPEQQIHRILALYELVLRNKYADKWKGMIEKYHLFHTAGKEGGYDVEALHEIIGDLGGLLASRSINWSTMRDIAKDLKIFGFADVAAWVERTPGHHSDDNNAVWLELLHSLTDNILPQTTDYLGSLINPDPNKKTILREEIDPKLLGLLAADMGA